jgi:hypothetical protein
MQLLDTIKRMFESFPACQRPSPPAKPKQEKRRPGLRVARPCLVAIVPVPQSWEWNK